MGAGDSKLLGAIGAFIGAKDVTIVFLFSALIGGVYAIVIIFFNRHKYKGFFSVLFQSFIDLVFTRQLSSLTVNTDKGRPKLCYGLSIALATGIYMVLQINSIRVIPL